MAIDNEVSYSSSMHPKRNKISVPHSAQSGDDASFIDHNAGAGVGQAVGPVRPKYKLADLMAEFEDGMPIDEAWDQMPPVGRERI